MEDPVSFIKELVRLVMPSDVVHGYQHVIRVLGIVEELSRNYEGVIDKEALRIAALLHDIGRWGAGGGNHAEASARVAEHLLSILGYPEGRRRLVSEIIRQHSFSSGLKPRNLEAKILSDADKLDALGAIGIVRVFMYSCREGRGLKESINHFYDKILKLPALMSTPEGRAMAEERVKIVREFLKELAREI